MNPRLGQTGRWVRGKTLTPHYLDADACILRDLNPVAFCILWGTNPVAFRILGDTNPAAFRILRESNPVAFRPMPY